MEKGVSTETPFLILDRMVHNSLLNTAAYLTSSRGFG